MLIRPFNQAASSTNSKIDSKYLGIATILKWISSDTNFT
jgi:hypothetical protein